MTGCAVPRVAPFRALRDPGRNGTIVFNNGQRGFHKEDETGVSNVMYKTTSNAKKPKSGSFISNNNKI